MATSAVTILTHFSCNDKHACLGVLFLSTTGMNFRFGGGNQRVFSPV